MVKISKISALRAYFREYMVNLVSNTAFLVKFRCFRAIFGIYFQFLGIYFRQTFFGVSTNPPTPPPTWQGIYEGYKFEGLGYLVSTRAAHPTAPLHRYIPKNFQNS